MGKMINVRVKGLVEEQEEEKKCALVAPSLPPPPRGRNDRRKKNMTCNSYSPAITGNSEPDSDDTSTVIPTTIPASSAEIDRIINKPRPSRIKFSSSLSPPPRQQQEQQPHKRETYTTTTTITRTSIISPIPKRRRAEKNSLAVIFRATSVKKSGNLSSSKSPLSIFPFTVPTSLLTTPPILIPLILLLIVTVPVSGLATEMLPTTTSQSSLSSSSTSSSPPHSSSHLPPSSSSSVSTEKTLASSSSIEFQTEGMLPARKFVEDNHHHHPHSSSSLSISSHLVELPLSDDPISTNGQRRQQQQQQTPGHHTCYVCLPPDKTSREAEEIVSIFPVESRQHIPDCASFGSHNANHFEFKCPPEYIGCLLRIHGKNESRSCGKFPLNDCKTANSVELCYCTGALCNGNRPDIIPEEDSDERHRAQLEDEKEERENRKIWQKGETDDEDLLGPHRVDIDGMQDDTGDYGSGGGSEPPPGVIQQYTSTPKPTLIPNIRPDSRTTTPKSVSGAPGSIFRLSSTTAFKIPFTTIIIPVSAALASLVPLLLSSLIQIWDLSSSLQPLVNRNQ